MLQVGAQRAKTVAPESGSENRAKAMGKPVVGVIANAHRVEGRFSAQHVGEHNLRAVAEVADALPVMFAGSSDITDIGALAMTARC